MTRLVFACLVAALAVPSSVCALGVANPAATVSYENYGFTMEVEDQNKTIGDNETSSRRYLGKAIWGAASIVDLYARLGTSDLRVHVPDAPDFRSDQNFAYGGGVRFKISELDEPKLITYLDLQYLTYDADGEILVSRSEDGDTWVDKYVSTYDWQETQFSLFTMWDRDIWQPYLGFSLTNISSEVDKDLYMIFGEAQQYVGSEHSEFRDNLIPELVLGMDIKLGGTGRFSGEMRLGEHFCFSIGMSELWR